MRMDGSQVRAALTNKTNKKKRVANSEMQSESGSLGCGFEVFTM